MKLLLAITLCFSIMGCAAYKPKRTEFYNKEGKLVKSFIGRGVFDGNDWLGTYKIWVPYSQTSSSWNYYEYTCQECKVVEVTLEVQQ